MIQANTFCVVLPYKFPEFCPYRIDPLRDENYLVWVSEVDKENQTASVYENEQRGYTLPFAVMRAFDPKETAWGMMQGE